MGRRGQQGRIMRIITVPVRFLSKAKDVYIRSMTNCGARMAYTGPVGYISGGGSGLPKSFSSRYDLWEEDDDYRELVREASTRTMAAQMGMDLRLQRHIRDAQVIGYGRGGFRSYSVGMANIQEEPEDFFAQDDDDDEL